MYQFFYRSPMGLILLESDGHALTALDLNPDREGKSTDLPIFRAVCRWLDDYFQGREGAIDFSLKPEGTAFQRMIWQLLLTVPYGHSQTYGEIARQLAALMGREKMSSQAVGQAVGRNPIPIIIPCHRILGAGGRLTGYSAGLDKKRWLLRHEGIPYQEEIK